MTRKKKNNDNDDDEDSVLLGAGEFSEEFTSAVGKLTLNFAHLEFIFTLFAGMQMRSGYPINELVLSEFSFRQLINVSVGIYKLYEPSKEEYAEFQSIVKRATHLEQQRNTITHSFYGTHEKTKSIVRYKNVTRAKSGYKKQREEITAASVLAIAMEIEETSLDLGGLMYKINERLWAQDESNHEDTASS